MPPTADYTVPPAAKWSGTIVPFQAPLLRIRYPHGVYVTLAGYVDWLPYARAVVQLPPVDPGASYDQVRVYDVLTANEAMAASGDPLWERAADGVAPTPDGWLWRHVPGVREIVLVPAEAAVAFRHSGGISTLEAEAAGVPDQLAIAADSGEVAFLPAAESGRPDLTALEKELPGPLPAAYREFVERHDGARPATVALHPGCGVVLDQSFLRAGAGRKNMLNSVGYVRRWVSDRFTDDFLAITRAQGGMVAVRLTGPDPGSVWFWDADDPRDDDRYDAAVVCRDLLRWCADSFEDFLRALVPVPEPLRDAARLAVETGVVQVARHPEMGGSLLTKDRR